MGRLPFFGKGKEGGNKYVYFFWEGKGIKPDKKGERRAGVLHANLTKGKKKEGGGRHVPFFSETLKRQAEKRKMGQPPPPNVYGGKEKGGVLFL